MSFHIVVTNRLIKLTGALVKGFGYIFHGLFPNVRFTIPAYSPAKIKRSTNTDIPKQIWQTNFTEKASLPVYVNYLFNRLMSLDCDYRYVSTEARLEYIRANATPEQIAAFEDLTNGAAQADFWRVFVLNREGGVYMDIDAHLVWPLGRILEGNYKEIFLRNKQHYTNYFVASAPNNPVLEKTLELMTDNIKRQDVSGGVYDLTGPTVLNNGIGDAKINERFYRITCNQGSFTNEYFQYIDRPRSKWTYQKNEDLLVSLQKKGDNE